MSAHTKGPWLHDKQSNIIKTAATAEGLGGRLHTLVCDANGVHPADLRLIAAAPDLLEALEDMIRDVDGVNVGAGERFSLRYSTVERMRAAIAKAKCER